MIDEIENNFNNFCADNHIEKVVSAKVGRSIMICGAVSENQMNEFCSQYGYSHTEPRKIDEGLTFYIY